MSRISTFQVHRARDCVCVGTAFTRTGRNYYCFLNFHQMTSKRVTFYVAFIESKLTFSLLCACWLNKFVHMSSIQNVSTDIQEFTSKFPLACLARNGTAFSFTTSVFLSRPFVMNTEFLDCSNICSFYEG